MEVYSYPLEGCSYPLETFSYPLKTYSYLIEKRFRPTLLGLPRDRFGSRRAPSFPSCRRPPDDMESLRGVERAAGSTTGICNDMPRTETAM